MIRRSPQVSMLLSSDIDAREIRHVSRELMDLARSVFGARHAHNFSSTIPFLSTCLYHFLSILSDDACPGQSFCGIRLYIDENGSSELSPMRSLRDALQLQHLGINTRMSSVLSISVLQGIFPYLGSILHQINTNFYAMYKTMIHDDSDLAYLNDEDGPLSQEQLTNIISRNSRQDSSQTQTITTQGLPQMEGVNGIHGDNAAGINHGSLSQWIFSMFTHSHLLLFAVFGIYLNPVLRLHAVNLISPSSNSNSGNKRVFRYTSLKILAWFLGGKMLLLVFYKLRQMALTYLKKLRAIKNDALVSALKMEEVPESQSYAQSNSQCPICVDVVKNPVVSTCGHMYCRKCMEEMLKNRVGVEVNYDSGPIPLACIACAVCRHPIVSNQIRHTYG